VIAVYHIIETLPALASCCVSTCPRLNDKFDEIGNMQFQVHTSQGKGTENFHPFIQFISLIFFLGFFFFPVGVLGCGVAM